MYMENKLIKIELHFFREKLIFMRHNTNLTIECTNRCQSLKLLGFLANLLIIRSNSWFIFNSSDQF